MAGDAAASFRARVADMAVNKGVAPTAPSNTGNTGNSSNLLTVKPPTTSSNPFLSASEGEEEEETGPSGDGLPPRLPPRRPLSIGSTTSTTTTSATSTTIGDFPEDDDDDFSEQRLQQMQQQQRPGGSRPGQQQIPAMKASIALVNRRPPVSRCEGIVTAIKHKGQIRSLALTPNTLCTGTSNVRIWSLSSGDNSSTVELKDVRITAMGMSLFFPPRRVAEPSANSRVPVCPRRLVCLGRS